MLSVLKEAFSDEGWCIHGEMAMEHGVCVCVFKEASSPVGKNMLNIHKAMQ